MRRISTAFTAICLVAWCLPLGAAQSSSLPRASEVVRARAYVSLEPVPRGRRFEVAVVAETRPGFHINAHPASENYLIPTTLDAELPPGLRVIRTVYPPGVLRKFRFSPEKLLVYEGSTILRMELEAALTTPLGPRQLALALRYQACNQEACLPPVKIPVTAELQIVAEGTLALPAHPDVFTAPRPKTPPPH